MLLHEVDFYLHLSVQGVSVAATVTDQCAHVICTAGISAQGAANPDWQVLRAGFILIRYFFYCWAFRKLTNLV